MGRLCKEAYILFIIFYSQEKYLFLQSKLYFLSLNKRFFKNTLLQKHFLYNKRYFKRRNVFIMAAYYLPSILVPLVGLVFPALTMASLFLYIEKEDVL